MAEPVKKAAAPECLITRIVRVHQARLVAQRFFDGESPRTLAKVYGLSRVGVEHLIRQECRLRVARRSAR